jgi:cob(I)alamin adenosyltransferase
MRTETAAMLKDLEYELFESEEHASTRAVLNMSPQNDGESEDIDTILDRIDEYAPATQQLINSFLKIPVSQQS